MRREIFEKVRAVLFSLDGMDGEHLIKHVDLWNRNVEFAGQEENWPRPAVFVEFGVIDWVHDRPAPGKRCSMRCTADLFLHVVTDWPGVDSCGYICSGGEPVSIGLCGALEFALTGLSGNHFSGMAPLRELSNHDHGELLEEIVVMRYRGHVEF